MQFKLCGWTATIAASKPPWNETYPPDSVILQNRAEPQISQLAALHFSPSLTFQKCHHQSSLGLNHVPPPWSHCRPIISTGQLFYTRELLCHSWISNMCMNVIHGYLGLHFKNHTHRYDICIKAERQLEKYCSERENTFLYFYYWLPPVITVTSATLVTNEHKSVG